MLLRIKVKTNSSKSELVWEKDCVKAFLKSSPEKGRANNELVRLLSKKYSRVRIVKGLKGRDKTVLVQ